MWLAEVQVNSCVNYAQLDTSVCLMNGICSCDTLNGVILLWKGDIKRYCTYRRMSPSLYNYNYGVTKVVISMVRHWTSGYYLCVKWNVICQ